MIHVISSCHHRGFSGNTSAILQPKNQPGLWAAKGCCPFMRVYLNIWFLLSETGGVLALFCFSFLVFFALLTKSVYSEKIYMARIGTSS